MAKSIYVSSTFVDLKEHRAAVCDTLDKMRFTAIGMEDYVARDARTVDVCLRDVQECDIYLGIFAWRYGYVPPEQNPDGRSITEFEYRHAKKLNKPRLLFVLDAAAPWSDEFQDVITGENEKGLRIQRLREDVNRDRMPGLFNSVHDLALNAAAALHVHSVDAKTRALSADLASASCLTMNSSSQPEIIANIRQAITENVKTDVIKVNLGHGESWWSTRVHLLAALCAEYTEVRQLLFEAEGYRFLGICAPSQARRALARDFPAVENAYRASVPLPNEVSFNPTDDVKTIVDRFSAEMDALGGELTVKRWVEPHLIGNWPGVNRPSQDVRDSGVTPALLETVVQRDEPFIVLVRNGIVQQVVDRAALATRMALAG